MKRTVPVAKGEIYTIPIHGLAAMARAWAAMTVSRSLCRSRYLVKLSPRASHW